MKRYLAFGGNLASGSVLTHRGWTSFVGHFDTVDEAESSIRAHASTIYPIGIFEEYIWGQIIDSNTQQIVKEF